MINVDATVSTRFWQHVQKLDTESCWMWTGATSTSGNCVTGKWTPPRYSKLSCHVHRAVWQLTNGEVPAGKRVRHTCTSLLCCNPNHLKIADDLNDRFSSKVDKTPGLGVGDCWLWTARINEGGYGQFRPDPKKSHTNAHRVAWELHHDQKIPEGFVIAHKCDIRSCCNPDHLFLATQQENMDDMREKKRDNYHKLPPLVGSKNGNAKINEDDVREIKKMLREKVAYKKISERFGIGNSMIGYIKNGKFWKEIE
jgi:HNH endonuclease